MKKIHTLCLSAFFLLVSMVHGAVAQANHTNTSRAGSDYFIARVKHKLKKEGIIASISIDIGTDESHPLRGQVSNLPEGKIRVGRGYNVQVIGNETDMLNYFEEQGWKWVDVKEIIVINAQYLQYLFKC